MDESILILILTKQVLDLSKVDLNMGPWVKGLWVFAVRVSCVYDIAACAFDSGTGQDTD